MSNADDNDNDSFSFEMSDDMKEKMRVAAEANAGMELELQFMEEDALKELASGIEQVLVERFTTSRDAPLDEDGSIDMMSMYLPQSVMNAVRPFLTGIMLSEDDLDVVPGGDLPLMCRIDGYLPID